MKLTIRAFALAILTILAALATRGADATPNFTGEWKVNVKKSDFGPLFAPKSAQVKIDQKDTTLAITDKETNEQDETNTVDSKFVTDGSRTTGTIVAFPLEINGAAKWVGATLTLVGDGRFNGTDVHIEEEWQLAKDGASFTITRKLSALMGTTNQTVLLEK